MPADYGLNSEGKTIPSIMARDQNIQLFRTPLLQVIVGQIGVPKVVANNNYVDFNSSPYTEIQQSIQLEDYQIDLTSRNNDARDRNWEIITALRSINSIQAQEANNFKIFRMPTSFVNTGQAEGGSDLNRFTIVIKVLAWYHKTIALGNEYYEQFSTRVDDEQSITEPHGIIEFNNP